MGMGGGGGMRVCRGGWMRGWVVSVVAGGWGGSNGCLCVYVGVGVSWCVCACVRSTSIPAQHFPLYYRSACNNGATPKGHP